MEQNKGFWYADWSFPIFVGLLSSGVFAGTHMYYLYGIGAFNEVAFVAMLKSGIDTGVYGAVAAFGASFLFARIIEGSLVGILDIGGGFPVRYNPDVRPLADLAEKLNAEINKINEMMGIVRTTSNIVMETKFNRGVNL